MKAKFAKAIAQNIRIIAESTAAIALIDDKTLKGTIIQLAEARCNYRNAVEQCESNIAGLLQQPGCHQND